MTSGTAEFAVQVQFDQRRDGRFHIHSPSIPGLHLAGRDLDKIRADLEPIVKDLLFHNLNMIVDKIGWVPSIDEVVKRLTADERTPPPEPKPGKPSFLVIVGRAA